MTDECCQASMGERTLVFLKLFENYNLKCWFDVLRIHPKVEHLRNFGNISGSGSGMFTIANGFANFVNAIAKVRNCQCSRNCKLHWSGSNLSRMQQKCHAADGFRYSFRAKASLLKSSKRQMSPTLENAFEQLQLNFLKTKHMKDRSSWLKNVWPSKTTMSSRRPK